MSRLSLFLFSIFCIASNFTYANTGSPDRGVRISKIEFVGNQKLTDGQLKEQLTTKVGQTIDLSREKPFDRDIQKLNFIYFKEGYVQAKVNQPEIVFAPDGKSARLVFNLKEGDRYKMGKVGFSGNWPGSNSDLLAATHLHRERFFNYQVLQDDLKILETKSGNNFYPLPRTRIREADHEVDVTFELAEKRS